MYVFVHPRVLSAYSSEYLSHKEDVGYIAQSGLLWCEVNNCVHTLCRPVLHDCDLTLLSGLKLVN